MQKGPDTGKAKIFVDGSVVQTVDTYAASVGQKKFLWNGVLPAGPHTVSVAWTGTKNKNSSGFDIASTASPSSRRPDRPNRQPRSICSTAAA